MALKKKLAALLLSFVMMVSLTGCMGNFYSWVVKVDGTEITPGLYLMYQLKAYSDAEALAEDAEKDVLKQKIEGQSAKSWIRQQTEEYCRRHVAVLNLAAEYNVKLSEESWSYMESNLQYWEYMSGYYENNGVGLDSWRYQMENSFLDDELFFMLFGEGGELAHPVEESKKLYSEQNAHIRYLSIPTSDEAGLEDLTDNVTAMAETLAQDLKSGQSFDDIVLGLADIYDLLGREFDLETTEDYIYTGYVEYASEYYDEELLDQLASATIGDVNLYNNGTTIMLYQVIETFENNEQWEDNEQTILVSLYRDEYDDFLKDIYNGYSFSKAFGAQWYYRPSKID